MEIETVDEHRAPFEHPAFIGRQHVVRPIDRSAQRSVPLGDRVVGTAEQPELLVEALSDLPRTHRAHTRCGKLDGEGNAVEPYTHVAYGGGVALVEIERSARVPGAQH